MPGRTDALEHLVDFCRHASQPFHLNTALGQLSDAYAAQNDFTRAEQALVELVERNKNDERLVERLNQLRTRTGGSAVPEPPAAAETPASEPESRFEEQTTTPVAAAPEEVFDEETQQYIAQALTDVDLFSSYGLTQKATHLLENVLQKAPRHTPTLERLLDLYLGAGNDRRTAELASQLEQIHRERGDIPNADRFAELTRRYSKVAGISAADLPQVPPAPVQAAAPPAMEFSGIDRGPRCRRTRCNRARIAIVPDRGCAGRSRRRAACIRTRTRARAASCVTAAFGTREARRGAH